MGLGRGKSSHVLAAAAVLFLLSANLSGCAAIRSWDEVRGRVLDADTKEPVEGVVVVYHWEGTASSIVVSRDQCYHVESAVTDAGGVFTIPAWNESFCNSQHMSLDPKWRFLKVAYKPGYRLSDLSYKEQAQQQNLVYLKKHEPKFRKERLWYLREEQLWYLLDVIRSAECGEAENMREELLQLYSGIYFTAEKLARTNKEQEIVDKIKRAIVILLSGAENEPSKEEINRFFEKYIKEPSR